MLKELAAFALGYSVGGRKKGEGLGFLIVLGLFAYMILAILVGIYFMLALFVGLPLKLIRGLVALRDNTRTELLPTLTVLDKSPDQLFRQLPNGLKNISGALRRSNLTVRQPDSATDS